MRMPKISEANEHPARKAARLSRTYYAQRRREDWLNLWSEQGEIRDPFGVSFIDPEGTGFSTPEAREKWYDENSDIEFYYAMVASFAAGNQVANYETLICVFEHEGVKSSFKCEGIWTYSVDDEGKLLTMYGYWEADDMIASQTILTGEYDHQFYVE